MVRYVVVTGKKRPQGREETERLSFLKNFPKI